jgi:hypothetical protein
LLLAVLACSLFSLPPSPRQGLISSIQSFRQRFTEEEVEPIDWESV